MNELQEEIDAINFADRDELSLTIGVGWNTYLKILFPMMPFLLVCAALPAAIIAAIPFDQITQNMGVSRALTTQMRIEQIVTAPFGAVVALTAIVACVRAMACNRLGVFADFKTAMRRFLPMLGSGILLGLIFFGIVVAFLILAVLSMSFFKLLAVPVLLAMVCLMVMLVIKYTFIGASVVAGGMSGMAALRESAGLVKGCWWATFGVIFLCGLVGALLQIPSFCAGLIEGQVIGRWDGYAVKAVLGTVTISLGFAATVFGVTANTTLYLIRRSKARAAAGFGPDPAQGASQGGDGEQGYRPDGE